MKKNYLYLLSILLILISSLIISCAGKEEGPESIEYLSMWNQGEPEALFLLEVMQQFQAETGIEVKVSWAGRDNLNKVRTRFLSQDTPDLIDQGFSELGALFQGEVLLQPIDDLFTMKVPEEDVVINDLLDQNILDLYKIGGERYYFPLKLVTSGFFYDKKIFEKYGVDVPITWKEFIENGNTMKGQGFPPLALDGTITFYSAYYFYWAAQRIMGNGAFHKAAEDKTGAVWKSDPGYLEVAKLEYELSSAASDFFQPGYSGSSWPAAQSDWALNKSGSILVGSWIASETKKQQTATFDIGFYPFPLVEGGKGKITDVEILPFGFAIPRDAKYPNEAKLFLSYLLQKDNQEKFVAMTDNFAPRKGTAYPASLKDLESVMRNANYHLVYDGVQQDFPEWLTLVFYPLHDQLIAGQMTPEEFIESISENSKNYWSNK